MYQNIKELPTQVMSALSDEDARAWMDKYNESIGGIEDPSESDVLAARRNAWYSVKDSPSSYSFCAKATVEAVDKQRELVDLDSVKDLMDDYIAHSGPMSWDHSNYIIGTVWGWEPIETENGPGISVWGNLFKGDEPVYKTARKAFSKGANKLSVAGDASKEDRTCDSDHGCYVRRKMRQLMEIAVTPHPVNKYATLIWQNDAALAKSEQSIGEPAAVLDLKEVMLHRSEEDCPIMLMRNRLRKSGIDAHARKEGVFIPGLSAEDCASIAEAGYRAEPCEGGVLIPSPEKVLEAEFKKSYRYGEITRDGEVLWMPESRFKDLYTLGMIEARDDGFWFASSI